LFWKREPEELMQGPHESADGFAGELKGIQNKLVARLRQDPVREDWINAEALKPHVRLQQLCDALSLSLSEPVIPPEYGEAIGLGGDRFDLRDVPRRNWEDRVTIQVRPTGDGNIVMDPYPFDLDPLPVSIAARIFEHPPKHPDERQSWWQAQPVTPLTFQYRSA
jgi:hypothetical protein